MTNKIQNPNDITWENRLIFATSMPEAPEQAAEKPALADLSASVQQDADKEAADILGHPLSRDILNDPDSFAETVTHLEESYNKFDQSLDRLYAIFAAKGISKKEVAPYLENKDRNEPWENPDTADTAEPEPKDWKDKHINTSWKDHNHAEHAANKLKAIPDLKKYVEESSKKYGVPESTIISIIEMESGWNIKSKCPTTSATGLCQAIDKTWNRYKREINSNAQRTNPKDAIDFVGWYCKDLISTVNNMIDKSGQNSGFKQEYKISTADIENLYMAYNNGLWGYLVLRRYVDNKTDQNFKNLTGFQKEIKNGGKHGWEHRYNYAKSVARVAKAYRELYGDSIPA